MHPILPIDIIKKMINLIKFNTGSVLKMKIVRVKSYNSTRRILNTLLLFLSKKSYLERVE